ncbi:MAG: hypothetical protein LBO21_05570 [Synergistaceae bacterium]|jgi:hypothetical protein|nr:hypothetical protein [Synergistaceae bacterium]
MAEIITFDPAYFQELTKDLGDVSRSLDDAKASLQKVSVGLDSGLVAFALCVSLNNDIKKVQKTTNARISETNGYSKSLQSGIMRVNGWEETTKNRESGLASQLVKTWGFENANFAGVAAADSSRETTPTSLTSPGNPNLAAQNMDSKFYTQNFSGIARTLIYNGKERMNCVYYARARAMEANQMTEWTGGNQGQSEIRANSIAKFLDSNGNRHDVFIESVEYDSNNQPMRVTLSESNMGSHPDGRRTTVDWEHFKNRDGKTVDSYTYL